MRKILSLMLFLAFLFIYADFGHDGGFFTGIAEFELLHDPANFQYPVFLIIFIAQIMLLLGALIKNRKIANYITGAAIIILSLITFVIMCFDLFTDPWAICTAIPFLIILCVLINLHLKNYVKKV